MPVEVNEYVIVPDRLTQAYDTLHDSSTEQTKDKVKLSLEDTSPADIPHLTTRINTRQSDENTGK